MLPTIRIYYFDAQVQEKDSNQKINKIFRNRKINTAFSRSNLINLRIARHETIADIYESNFIGYHIMAITEYSCDQSKDECDQVFKYREGCIR